MAPQYSMLAKRRIVQKGAAEIGRFIDEVPPEKRAGVFGHLPRVPGFRARHKMETNERRKRFIARLTEAPIDDAKHAADNDWATFHRFWVEWGCFTFGEGARAVLERKSASKNDNGTDAAKNFLTDLEKSVGRSNLTREDLARLFQFSGYEVADLIEQSIESVPTRAQREREQRLETLGPKLDELAAQASSMEDAWRKGLEDVTAKFGATEGQLSKLEKSTTDAARRLDALSILVEGEKQQRDALRQEFGQLAKDLSVLRDAEQASFTSLTDRLEATVARGEALREDAVVIKDSLHAVSRRILEAESAIEQLQDHLTANSSEVASTPDQSAGVAARVTPASSFTSANLGAALFKASPGNNSGLPRIMVMDAALRARELPVLIGSFARDYAEAWLTTAGGVEPVIVSSDPTLLSLQELTPHGSKGERAPFAIAFSRAAADVRRPVVVMLDDLDPASASFWLPELARAYRQPVRYGFPPNLLFLALLEADPSQMGLNQMRAAELFPLVFADCKLITARDQVSQSSDPGELSLELLVSPKPRGTWAARVSAIEESARHTLEDKDCKTLSLGFASFLKHAKGHAGAPSENDTIGNCLLEAARLLVREQ